MVEYKHKHLCQVILNSGKRKGRECKSLAKFKITESIEDEHGYTYGSTNTYVCGIHLRVFRDKSNVTWEKL